MTEITTAFFESPEWEQINSVAEKYELTVDYVLEEFVIQGVLINPINQ